MVIKGLQGARSKLSCPPEWPWRERGSGRLREAQPPARATRQAGSRGGMGTRVLRDSWFHSGPFFKEVGEPASQPSGLQPAPPAGPVLGHRPSLERRGKPWADRAPPPLARLHTTKLTERQVHLLRAEPLKRKVEMPKEGVLFLFHFSVDL